MAPPCSRGDGPELRRPVPHRSELEGLAVCASLVAEKPQKDRYHRHLCSGHRAVRTPSAAEFAYAANLQRIKQRMIEIEGKGFKYIVNTTFSENLGQAGRADMSCHWEDTDAAVQEMFSNVSGGWDTHWGAR